MEKQQNKQHEKQQEKQHEKRQKPAAKSASPAKAQETAAAGAATLMRGMMEMNAAQLNAFSEIGRRYMDGLIKLNGEMVDFLSSQAAMNGEFGRRLAECDNLADAARFCQEWTGSAMETCMAESRKLTDITAAVAQDSWDPMIESTNAMLRGMARPGE